MAEVMYEGVGTPVERPQESVSGSEFVLGIGGVTFTNANAPGEIEIVDQVVPQAGPPGGNATVVQFFSPPLNFGNR